MRRRVSAWMMSAAPAVMALCVLAALAGCSRGVELESPVSTHTPTVTGPVDGGVSHPLWIPIGPFHLPDSQFGQPFTGAFRMLDPDSITATLEAARAEFFDLYINLAGPRSFYQNPDGSFCLSCFKARLDRFAGFEFTPYVIGATVRGHILFDDPQEPSNWDGQPVPYELIDSAAAYSRALFPAMPAGIGAPPSWLVGGAPWGFLQFGFAQYTMQKGGIVPWRDNEIAAAHAQMQNVVFGINVLTGNNGGPVAAYQLRHWLRQLACHPSTLGILLWENDSAYFADPAISAAVDAVVLSVKRGQGSDPFCGTRKD